MVIIAEQAYLLGWGCACFFVCGAGSDEAGARRKRVLRREAQLRGAIAGRRRMRGGATVLRRSRSGRR